MHLPGLERFEYCDLSNLNQERVSSDGKEFISCIYMGARGDFYGMWLEYKRAEFG